MRVVRGGDHDELHGLVSERLVQVLISLHAPEPHRLGANLGIARHDPMKRQLRLPPDERTVKGPSRQAMSHHDCRNHVCFPISARSCVETAAFTRPGR